MSHSKWIHACYKYIGKGRISLERGEKYNLSVYEFNLFERLFGHHPFGCKLMGYGLFDSYTPLYPYKSWEEFNKDWERIPQKPRKRP